MEPRIEDLGPKKLVGMRARMSLANDSTAQLWRRLMPRRAEIRGRTSPFYVSMRVYDGSGNEIFAPEALYEKWAAVEVENHGSVPEGMEPYDLTGGKYAVFVHRGPASTFADTMRFIFGRWLPESGYRLDCREHFELLEEGWDPNDPEAEEQIWVPIKSPLGQTDLL